MADKPLTIFDRLLDEEKQEEKPETIFDRLLREEGEQEKEERYREAEITSQPLPALAPVKEEDRERWADIEREQEAEAARVFHGEEVPKEPLIPLRMFAGEAERPMVAPLPEGREGRIAARRPRPARPETDFGKGWRKGIESAGKWKDKNIPAPARYVFRKLYGPYTGLLGGWGYDSKEEFFEEAMGGTPDVVAETYYAGKGDPNSMEALRVLRGIGEAGFGEETGQYKNIKPMFDAVKKAAKGQLNAVEAAYGKDSKAYAIQSALAGAQLTAADLTQVMFGTRGGVYTLGIFGGLAPAIGAGSVPAVATSKGIQTAFAISIIDGVDQSKDHFADVIFGVNEDGTPKYSQVDRWEAGFGVAAAAAFSAALAKGVVNKAAIKKRYGVTIEKDMTPAKAAVAAREIMRINEKELVKEKDRDPLRPLPGELIDPKRRAKFFEEVGRQQLVKEHQKGDPIGGYGERGVPTPERVLTEAVIPKDVPLAEPVIPKDPEMATDILLPKEPEIAPDKPVGEVEIVPKPEPVIPAEPRPITGAEMVEPKVAGTVQEAAQSMTLPEFVEWHKAQGFEAREVSRELMWESFQKAERPPTPVEAEVAKADDGKVYVERRYNIEENPEKFTYEDEIADINDKTVIEPVDNALFDAKLADNNLGFKELERRRTEIKEQQKKLQNQGVFEGPINNFNKGMTDKLVGLMRDKGDAMERWEADHKPLYDQYYELEKQYKLLHKKWEYNSSIEEVLSREVLELQGLIRDFIPTEELPDTLYHVTLSQEVPSIMKEGIVSGGGKSFKGLDITDPRVQAAVEEGKVGGLVKGGLLEKGGVHVFDSYDSALAWATRMDWEISGKHGSGKISIIPVTDKYSWSADPKLFAGQIGEGRALIRGAEVNPKSLGKPIVFDEAVMGEFSRARKAGEAPKPPSEAAADVVKAEADVVKAVEKGKAEEAKVEEVVEIVKETKEAGEEKIAEAVEGEMFPSAGTARKFHTTILRAKELARKEKDFDFIRRFDVNPDSAYFTVPTSRWARTIDTFDLATADTALAEYGATKGVMRIGDPQELVGSLLKGRKQQLLLEKANKTGEKADRQAYEDFVQTLANDRTFVGQMMQTYSFFKVSDPVAVRDVYQEAITEAGGAKLTVEEQGTLLDMIKRVEETRKKSEELAEIHRDAELNPELSEAEINKAFEKADDAMLDWERAVVEQINLVGDKTPKLAVDMIVAQWQGNFLTPTTHAVNVYGNIFPMAPRAAARTGSRVYEAADRFLWGKSREMKLIELEKLQEKSPDPIRGETIKRLQQLTDPMEQSKLIPERFLHLYAKGITSGTGASRVWSAWKATRGKDKKGRRLEAFMTEFKRFKTPVGGDMLSSLVMGSDVNLYETGTMNMSNMTRPVDAFRAWQRLFGGKKSSKNVETVSKDLFEATFGMAPTIHFKGLMAGDVIFRNKEMMRLIDEQAAVRKWSPEKRARAIRNPKLMFTEKEMAQNRNRAAMASFQHETGWTGAIQKLNKWLSSGGAGRKALYLGWRGQTPYQKTLMNVTHELFQFSPFGAPYTMGRGAVSGLKGAWRGYKEEGAKGIRRGIQESYMPTKENLQIAGKNLVGLSIAMGAYKWLREDGIVAPDMNPVMSDPTDTAKVRYLTEETFHHGFINMSGLRRKFDNEDARWKEGDWVVDARRLGPIGHMLLSGAAVQRGLEKMPEKKRRKIEADWDKLIAHELTGSAVYANRYFWNQTMATGVKDFMQSLWWIKEGEGAGKMQKKLVKDFTSIFLPNTAQWLTKVDSPYKQSFKPSTVSEALKVEWETKSRSMFDRSRMEKVRVRDEKGKVLEEDVPVGLLGYPIIVDLWGSPLETMGEGRVLGVPLASWKTATWEKTAQGREDFWDRFMAKTFNVVDFKKSGKIADPYSGEVYRLMMKTGKGDVVPPMYSDKITVGEGKDRRRYKLNQDQYAYKSIMEGRYRLDGVSELVVSGARQMQRRWDTKGGWGFKQYMESSEFGRASDEEKISELQRIYKRARTAGVAALVEVGLMDNKSVRADLAMRKFNINPDNIPLTDDQLIEGPSGMRE
jgi:hypothetical protein